MKTWEKLQRLDTDYQQARIALLLGKIADAQVVVEKLKTQNSKNKNATKSSTKEHN